MSHKYENPTGNAPGQTQEQTQGQAPEAGVYEHPQTGRQIITMYDPLFGNAQSEAVVRLGFVRVRDAKPEEIKTLIDSSRDSKGNQINKISQAQEDKARLDALELAELRREKREREEAEAAAATEEAKKAEEEAKKKADEEAAAKKKAEEEAKKKAGQPATNANEGK